MNWQATDVRQRAILVEYDPSRMTPDESTRTLNDALQNGWRVSTAHPMGGTAGTAECPRFVSLVILTRD